MAGFYNENTLTKFQESYNHYVTAYKNGEDLKVSISESNSKMGRIGSVSLLPYLTCTNCKECRGKCYAARLAMRYKTTLNAYARNTALAVTASAEYWRQVRNAVGMYRFFRFHVSGDILTIDYFGELVKTVIENPQTEFLVFTKNYKAVNDYIWYNGDLPKNLHLLFSGWENLKPINPYNLPETNVIMKGCEPAEGWKVCGGNCETCAKTNSGCWAAKAGETIAFHIH